MHAGQGWGPHLEAQLSKDHSQAHTVAGRMHLMDVGWRMSSDPCHVVPSAEAAHNMRLVLP